MTQDLLFKELYKRSLRYLGIRLRSEKEMRIKMEEWRKKDSWAFKVTGEVGSEGMDNWPIIVNRVIALLKKENFINDEHFAREWIGSRIRNKPRGESILRMELQVKGVDKDLVDDVLNQLLNERESPNDENNKYKMTFLFAKKYVRKLHFDSKKSFNLKLKQALIKKGFELSVINRVVDDLWREEYNSDD